MEPESEISKPKLQQPGNEEAYNCHGKEVGITAVGEREKPIENPRPTRATLY